ncbi:protein LKAAEAR1-like [Hoplias malabaricus]|uniref:protein LKAAEAR1-like n=1 Tax=Hoplias malabaricus TaxID=27720 RepID=UPI0034622AF9
MTEEMDPERKRRSSTGAELRRMCPQQRARHLAYTEPSKEAKGWMETSRQRVLSWVAQERREQEKYRLQVLPSKLHQDKVVGQLKAAEARYRIRHMRLQYQNLKAQEINVMISCQSSAQSAARLELLLAQERKSNSTDSLDQLQRRRVEEILEDERGLTVIRG